MPAKTNYEVRQSLPSYYEEYAYKALFAARVLWQAKNESAHDFVIFNSKKIDKNKSIDEAFRREGSFAIELIVKAAIGHRLLNDLLNTKVRKISSSHDITVLWKEAELPPLEIEDKRRLIIATQMLYWSGRYGEAVRASKTLEISENVYRYRDRVSRNHYVLVESFDYMDIKNIFDIVVRQIEKLKCNKIFQEV